MDLSQKFCPKPFEYLDIQFVDGEFRCYVCCPTWLSVSVGDIEKEGLEGVWNGNKIKEIRKSILSGSYLYCNKDLCPDIQANTLHEKKYIYKKEYLDYLELEDGHAPHGPRIVYFSEDRTCNLACPSCRTDYIILKETDVERLIKARDGFLPELLKDAESLNICSSGDPFSSRIYRDFLFKFEGRHSPRLKINLNTNGVLLTPEVFDKMAGVHGNLGSIVISLDAAREDSYKIVRKGGDWKKVLENIDYLVQQRKKGRFDHLQLDFVVQDHNYREMPEFVKLGIQKGVDQVYFQRISNWGTFSKVEYEKRNVIASEHPLHQHFVNVCQHPLMNHSIVKRGNISRFIPLSRKEKVMEFLRGFPLLRRVRKKIIEAAY